MTVEFVNNKYKRWYDEIILRAKLEKRSKGEENYFERHHIIPFCISKNNDDDNLVLLSAREHIICHILLTKFTKGEYRSKMVYALSHMLLVSKTHKRIISARQYEFIKKLHSKVCSERRTKHTDVTKQKMSDSSWIKGKTKLTDSRVLQISENMIGHKRNLGRKHSEESKAKMSNARKLNDHWLGRKHSEESKAKMSQSQLGRKHSEETKLKISQTKMINNSNVGTTGMMWINDGVKSILIYKHEVVPEGFQKGRVKKITTRVMTSQTSNID